MHFGTEATRPFRRVKLLRSFQEFHFRSNAAQQSDLALRCVAAGRQTLDYLRPPDGAVNRVVERPHLSVVGLQMGLDR